MAKKKTNKEEDNKAKSTNKQKLVGKKAPVKKTSSNKNKKKAYSKKSKSNKKLPLKKLPPKKRGRKPKKKQGFSSNNFNSIRSLIWKEYGLDYKNYYDPEFLIVVKQIYYECKSLGRECSTTDVLQIYDEIIANPKRDYPYISEDLHESSIPYYDLISIEFSVFPSYLLVKSPMIIPPPVTQFYPPQYLDKSGDTRKGYKKFFKEFVDWANYATRFELGNDYDSGDVQIYIKFTKPEYDEINKYWHTEIYICTVDGIRHDFGFTPKGRSYDHDIEDEYVEAPERIKKELPPTPEQLAKIKKDNEELFGALINLKKKIESKKKSIARKQTKLETKEREQKIKQNELKRLKSIKKELESSIKLYKEIGDKRRLNKTMKDLDEIVAKIKKLS